MPKRDPFRNFHSSPEFIRLAVMQRFRRVRSLQKFASVHASVFTHFNSQRSLTSRQIFKLSRAAVLAEWRQLAAA